MDQLIVRARICRRRKGSALQWARACHAAQAPGETTGTAERSNGHGWGNEAEKPPNPMGFGMDLGWTLGHFGMDLGWTLDMLDEFCGC